MYQREWQALLTPTARGSRLLYTPVKDNMFQEGT